MTQRTLAFDRPVPPRSAPRRQRRRSLRQEYDEARLTIAKFTLEARLREANRELLQQRRHD